MKNKIDNEKNITDEIKEFIVEFEEEGDRLDIFLSSQLGDMSRSYIQKIIKDKKVKVNEKIEKAKYLVKEDDKVIIEIPAPKLLEIIPQDIPINIVYEDDDLLIINKPQGMVVHPAPGNYENTLVNAILYHCKDNLSSINGIIRPGIVHRIDKDTSGLLIVAKNDKAHINMSEQIKNHEVTKTYIALTRGRIKENEATINMPIGRNPNDRIKMAVTKNGKEAITHIKVIEKFQNYTLIEVKIETGRTHQIRVHLAQIGYPLVGDYVYSNGKNPFGVEGQMLHSYKLEFKHPITGKEMKLQAELPEYFENVLNILRKQEK